MKAPASFSLIVFFFLVSSCLTPQDKYKDSLLNKIRVQAEDTNRVNSYNSLSIYFLRTGKYDSSTFFAGKAIELATKKTFLRGLAPAYNNKGNAAYYQNNYLEAHKNYSEALKLYEGLKDKTRIANSHNNLGLVYSFHGDFADALQHYLLSLEIYTETGDKKGMGRAYNNIGRIYMEKGKYGEALKNQELSLAIEKEINHKEGIAGAYNNIGSIYMYRHENEKALQSFFDAIKIHKEIGNTQGIAAGLGNIGSIYTYQKKYTEALKYQLESLQLNEEIGDMRGVSTACNNIGSLYTSTGKNKEARNFLNRGLAVAKEISSMQNIKTSYEQLFVLDSISKNYPGAISNFRMFFAYRDSLNNEESTKRTVKTEMQFEFAKKITADSMRQLETHKIETIKHQTEIRNQKLYTYSGIAGFLVMIVIAAISFRAYKNKQKANIEIERQKVLVEEKQKEILGSIHYAKRIQTALLTNEKYFSKNLRRLSKN